MPKNPSQSKADCNYHAGLVNQDGLNNPKTANQEGYNTFDRSRINYQTQQFQTLQPCTVMAEISGNHARIKTKQDLRTYTLKSPLLSPTRMVRSFFQVPFSAIMPNTWEYIVRQPVRGEDISYSSVAPLLGIESLKSFLSSASSAYAKVEAGVGLQTDTQYLREFMLAFQLCDALFGSGGLVATMGYRFPGSVSRDKILSAWVDAFKIALDDFSGYDGTAKGVGSLVFIDADDNHLSFNCAVYSKVDLLSWMRDAYLYFFDQGENTLKLLGFTGDLPTFFTAVRDATATMLSDLASSIVVPEEHNTLDCMPFIAYQCIAAQFYTNSHVDDIYTSKMWQENALSFAYEHIVSFSLSVTDVYFSINGVSVPYDAYSGYFMNSAFGMITASIDASTGFSSIGLCACYLWNLFQLKSSMRYGDYFTSGRVQPLAVGDVNASVGGDTGSLYVSAVDVNQSLWMQRFLNAVNRTRQNIQDYLQSLTGVRPERVPPQPNFICTESFNIGNFEVENTAQEQGNVVTLLRNSESRFMYDAYFDEPSYIIGVDSFSVQMAYPYSSLKIYDANDRLDWFNSFMQHVGDQTITGHELYAGSQGATIQPDDIFAYQLRYAQFKFGISQASGGFTDGSLPSWAVLFNDFGFSDDRPQFYDGKISSYFLRNHNADFNPLYASLTGNSNSSFFHFIKSLYFGDFVNSRQQAYPSLL